MAYSKSADLERLCDEAKATRSQKIHGPCGQATRVFALLSAT